LTFLARALDNLIEEYELGDALRSYHMRRNSPQEFQTAKLCILFEHLGLMEVARFLRAKMGGALPPPMGY
jgi:hypothetical protein